MAKDARVYEKFLNRLVDEEVTVVIFLINGVKLQGVIDSFDEISVILKKDHYIQLLYRHAISTIVPQYKSESNA